MNEKDREMAAARKQFRLVEENHANTLSGASEPVEDSQPTRVDGINMVRAAEVVEKKIEWLWPSRIPKGYITYFTGDPGIGKSQVAGDLAARLSTGAMWPDSGKSEPGATLFINSEDGIPDVSRPRLRVAGAELNRIGFLTGKFKPDHPAVEFLLNLKDDLAEIEERLPEWQKAFGVPIRLLAVDPFMNHLGGVDPNKEGEARPLLAGIASFLSRTGLSMIGIRHMNKAEEKALLYRGGGSIAFTGAARAEYIVGVDPEDATRRVFARIKGNLSLEPDSLAFQVIASKTDPDIPAIEWLGPTSKRATDVIGGKQEGCGPQRERAAAMLTELLGEGHDVPAEEVFRKAEALGIGQNTVRAAAKQLGVIKRPSSFGGGWVWSLAEDLP